MPDTIYHSRWVGCDDCETVTIVESELPEGVPDENDWEEFGRCMVCGSSQMHWNADEDTQGERDRRRAWRGVAGALVAAADEMEAADGSDPSVGTADWLRAKATDALTRAATA